MSRKLPAWVGDAFTAATSVMVGATGVWRVGWMWTVLLLAAGVSAGMVVGRRHLLAGLARPRYRAVIVGRESGNRTPLDFIEFHTADQAMAFVVSMNAREGTDLTYCDWEKIPE